MTTNTNRSKTKGRERLQEGAEDLERYLLQLASFYLDCCQYKKAKKIIDYINAVLPRRGDKEAEKRDVLYIMVLFHLSDYRRCVNLATKLHNTTQDDEVKLYLLLTINKCFIALKDPDRARKYLSAYLKKLKKNE